jgi:hypothetical protein
MPDTIIPEIDEFRIAATWDRLPQNLQDIAPQETIQRIDPVNPWTYRTRGQVRPEPSISEPQAVLESSQEHQDMIERIGNIIGDTGRNTTTSFYDLSSKPFPDFFSDKKINNPKVMDAEILKEIKLKFKYVPIRISDKSGFIDVKNNVVYTKEWIWNGKLEKLYYTKSNIKNNVDEIIKKYFDINSLNNNCSIFVKDYIKSSKLFQLKEKKRVLVGKKVSIIELNLLSSVKRSDSKESIIRIKVNGEENSTRFHIDDLDFVYPNFNGYTIPKDRTIKIGSNVILINDKFVKTLKKGEKYKVDQIIKNGNKVYAYITPKNITDKQELVNIKKLKVI